MCHLRWWFAASELFAFATSFKYLGPSNFVFKYISNCEGVQSVMAFDITRKRYNRTVNLFDFDIITPYPIDNNLIVELKGSMKKDGGYKPGAFYLKNTMCKVLRIMIGDMLQDILHAADQKDCPLPSGHHKGRDYFFDNSKFNVPYIYGEYKMEIFVFNRGVMDSCYWYFYELVPKD